MYFVLNHLIFALQIFEERRALVNKWVRNYPVTLRNKYLIYLAKSEPLLISVCHYFLQFEKWSDGQRKLILGGKYYLMKCVIMCVCLTHIIAV